MCLSFLMQSFWNDMFFKDFCPNSESLLRHFKGYHSCLVMAQISILFRYFICCNLDCHKKLSQNKCQETPRHLLPWIQCTTCLCFQTWQVRAFMVPPSPGLPWLVRLGWTGFPTGVLPLPTSFEGSDSCSIIALERGEHRGKRLSAHKDFSYVSIRLYWVPNIAQLTSQRTPRPSCPCPPPWGCFKWTNHKGEGPVLCNPLFSFEVHCQNLGDNLPWGRNAN